MQDFLVPVTQQLGLIQHQMFEQFQQAMMMMFQMFGKLQQEQLGVIRDEMEHLRVIEGSLDPAKGAGQAYASGTESAASHDRRSGARACHGAPQTGPSGRAGC